MWDWREQPDLDRLADDIRDMTGGGLHLTEIPTGSDQYAIALSTRELTAGEAYDAYTRMENR
jgi:hypothetical protein